MGKSLLIDRLNLAEKDIKSQKAKAMQKLNEKTEAGNLDGNEMLA